MIFATVQQFYPETKGLTLQQVDTLFFKNLEVVSRLQEAANAVQTVEDGKEGRAVSEAGQRGKAGDP